ncbi:DUF6765 family protein [Sporomusa aerivorans]|uniref:DUF6765 family protein n=1 Tax=Sporomusa aerivorans TaxID=204936 RepID=UPI00352B0255
MQADFHYAVIYVLSRLTGFSQEDAKIISYSSQYVDDATNGGFIKFTNHPMYYRINSAHALRDISNLDDLANQHSWMPFHFLPGNQPADHNRLGFVSRLICRENSLVAQDMVKEAFLYKSDENGLHRLGVTLHVYADTWSHQGFVGIKHDINHITNLYDEESVRDFGCLIRAKIDDLTDIFGCEIIDKYLALGHGAALTCPDEPWLKWSYTDYFGSRIYVDNTERFMRAVDHIYMVLKRYYLGDPIAQVEPLDTSIRNKIQALFEKFTDPDGQTRNLLWLDKIRENHFGFGAEDISYVSKGIGSWKFHALGTENEFDSADDLYIYKDTFPLSDWKKLHDAIKDHWSFVIFKLLPDHGVIF